MNSAVAQAWSGPACPSSVLKAAQAFSGSDPDGAFAIFIKRSNRSAGDSVPRVVVDQLFFADNGDTAGFIVEVAQPDAAIVGQENAVDGPAVQAGHLERTRGPILYGKQAALIVEHQQRARPVPADIGHSAEAFSLGREGFRESPARSDNETADRKSVVEGKSVDLGGR